MSVNDFETGGDYVPKEHVFHYETANVERILNRKYLDVIVANNNEPTSDIITQIIEEHKTERNRTKNAYERYKAAAEGVPIFNRKFENVDKVNNKLNNDFMGEIIDTKIGYMYGSPIKYLQAEKDIPKDDYIWKFNRRSNVEDLDAETGKFSSICGYGARLLYVDVKKNERVMNLDPWEVIFIANETIAAPSYAFRYFDTTVYVNGEYKETVKVEFYNDRNVIYFEKGEDGKYKETKRDLNLFIKECPVIGFPNNEEYMGDCDKVLSLLDAYDITLSDVSSEITQMRLAYMVFNGDVEIDDEFMNTLKKTGGISLPDGATASFLTKSLDDSIIENHLNRLTENISRFAKHVNLTDDKFGGDLSGVAIKYKLTALENKCIYSERKFVASLRRQYEVLGSSAKANVDYLNLDFKFTRNLPVNIADEANIVKSLIGILSDETLLSILSFVPDPVAELEKLKKQKEEEVDLDEDLEDEETGEGAAVEKEGTGTTGQGITAT